MIVIDTVPADSVEIGDLISLDGDEFEVTKIGDSEDIDGVVLSGYNRSTGDAETHELPFDYSVDILGA